MSKQHVNVDGAPPAVGPYSHAVVANGFVFVSGQVPLAPDGTRPKGASLSDEARLALTNLKTVLEGAGSSLEHVVKTTVFIKDMDGFSEFNAVYGEFFGEAAPARSCVEAARLPKDFQVEVEAIALVPGQKRSECP